MLVLAAPNMLEFSFKQVEDVSTELRAELLQLEDICVILRMFWIVKISPERLRSLSNKSWNAILIDPVKVFPSVMWFEKDEEEEVRSFQNLEQVVKYIYRYRKIILIDLPTLSTDKKLLDRALGTDETDNSHKDQEDKKLLDRALGTDVTDNSHKDQEVDFDYANPPPKGNVVVPSNTGDGVVTETNGKVDTTESGNISTIRNSTAKNNESSKTHEGSPSGDASEDYTGEGGGFDNDEERENYWQQMKQGDGGRPGDGKKGKPGDGEKGRPGDGDEVLKKPPTNQDDAAQEKAKPKQSGK